VTGDGTGDRRTKPGVFRGQATWLLDLDGNYQFDESKDASLTFGGPGTVPITGVW